MNVIRTVDYFDLSRLIFVFFFRVTLSFFTTLIKCSGLKEDMDLEEAIENILSAHDLWQCVLTASGKKREELWKEEHVIKARKIILHLKNLVLTKSIKLNLFKKLQGHRELCLGFFTILQEDENKDGKKEWQQITDEIQIMEHNMSLTVGVFIHAKQNILKGNRCVEFCLKSLKEADHKFHEGDVNIEEARDLINNDEMLQHMWELSKNLKEMVQSEVFWNIFSQIEENKHDLGIDTTETEMENLQMGCSFLNYLSTEVQTRYREFWLPLLLGKDVCMSVLQNNMGNVNILKELERAEAICHCTATADVQQAFKMYSKFDEQREKVFLMSKVLNVFGIDVMNDKKYQGAISEYEKLLGDFEDLTLLQISSSLKLVEDILNIVDDNMLPIFKELKKASVLIDFLQTVVDEDIRNLIDAVEEHSEQYVRESTVSDLIEIKRFLQPLLKKTFNGNILEFFNVMKNSKEKSGIKRIEQKIHECSSNLHSLKALYNHVANRGEHTKEVIENIVIRGVFRFSLKEKDCDVYVEYIQHEKVHTHSKSYLNDLRSRALLILNTEEKQTDENKKELLSPFIEIVDTALDIGNTCVLLKGAGHFQYKEYEQMSKPDILQNLLVELKSKTEDWCKVLYECRQRFYLMNYIPSDQLQILYNFTKSGSDRDSVITIMKFINPSVSDLEDILKVLKQKHEDICPEKNLLALGQTLENIEEKIVPTTQIMYDKKPNSKLSDIVQAGQLYVTALEPDSQLVIRAMLTLHWHTTQTMPFAHNILLCNKNTSQDEITLLLNRCLGCKNEQLFTIASIENLDHETQDYLVESLERFQNNKSFHLALVFRGNSHHPFHEKFTDILMRPNIITENELQEFFIKKYPNVLTVTSAVPGLGKSEEVQQIALKSNRSKITLHISGIFDREMVIEELKYLKIKPYHILHIDIGPIDKPFELDIFLFELIILKHVHARKFAFHLQTDCICVEIANSVNQELSNSLPTVTCFRRKNLLWKNYSDMHVSQEINSPVQVVCHYLKLLDSGKLDQIDLYLTGNNRVDPLSAVVCREILQKHFSTSGDMSYAIVNIFLGVLADQLKKLSSSVFFRTSNIQHEFVKSELVKALKNMSMDFSSRSINACRSLQNESMGVEGSSNNPKKVAILSCAEVLAKRTESMIRWEDSNHLMVLFHHDLQTVSALYRDKDKVPQQISQLFESQLKKKLEDFSKKGQEELKSILLKLVQHPLEIEGGTLDEMSQQYALTPDNLLKMILIVLRIQGYQPIVIMGETGCGKTSLIRFLSKVCQIEFHVLSIHAGITEKYLMERINEIDQNAKAKLSKSVWLFLDEINTCDHLGLVCDVICHHHCKGTRLSPNLKILAACNPYRLRSKNSILTTGLQSKIKTDQLSKLVYRVNPLPEAMIDYVWDYGSLQNQDEESYIKRMIQGLFLDEKFDNLFVKLLIVSQEFVKNEEGNSCCVSLRDVERCKRLVIWFLRMLKEKDNSILNKPNKLESNAIILALSICYDCRFPDNEVRKCYRRKIAASSEMMADLQLNDEESIKKIIVDQQNDILNRMELPPGTAKNTALRENVFVILVCILNRIPVFVVGKPGCSKSLSMQLIRSNLRGKDSSDSFFSTQPQLYCVSFQGSESSTSDGIIKVFNKAQNYHEINKENVEDVLSVVILDEIGLAEMSQFNPLKVLHNLLEPEGQVKPDVSVVGISNWALDAAKMNRAIHLSRPEMDEEELHETALSITESLMSEVYLSKTANVTVKTYDKSVKQTEEIKQILEKLAYSYWLYNKNQKFKNFHGLRDFYSLVKYIGNRVLVEKNIEQVDDVIVHGLLRNFGGLSKEVRKSMLLDFQTCLETINVTNIDVLNLIQENLADRRNRHLMLITNGDGVLSVLEDTIREMKRQHVVIFGSRFEDDLTDDYNYRILSRIILCMEHGFILILKDLENIYGSLYDMLNQNYTVVGGKKNCRVALGSYSNPMCHVHEDFKCIVLVEESKLDFSDPPFLNRFEKQQFRFEDIMNAKAIETRDSLLAFTADVCKSDACADMPENAFALSGEDLLSSLVLKVQKEVKDKQNIAQRCENELLWITAPEAMVRIKDTVLWKNRHSRVNQLEKEYYALPIHDGLLAFLDHFHSKYSHENEGVPEIPSETSLTVVFTHDREHHSLQIQSSKFRMERLRNFKSEKQLNKKIQDFFESEFHQLLFLCNAAEDFENILLAKSVLEACKRNSSEPKNVCMICYLDRQKFKHELLTQINFLSGWKLAMLDKLGVPQTPLTKMINLPFEKVLKDRRPMIEAIRNNMFYAFTTIQYVGTGHTAENMLKLVCNLKDSQCCLSIIENLIFANINSSTPQNLEDWQKIVACDRHALVTASCFMNALEQYLLAQIKNPLCKIIFKLEEANAFDCVFSNDSGREKRIKLWKKMIMKDSFIDCKDIADPFGPECYTCCSERLCLKFPFSYTVICRIEKIKDDFLKTLQQLRISYELDNDDEIPTEMLKGLVEIYLDNVRENINEYIEEDYPEKFTEYQHDFYLMMSSKNIAILTEGERVQIMKWTQSHFDAGGSYNEFDLQVTNLHVLHWVYSSVFHSIIKVIEVVKEHTNISVESFLSENLEDHVNKRDMFVERMCKIFLPTENFMNQFQSVQKWQYLVSSVLPFIGKISINSSYIHKLRFCNDVAQSLLSLDQKTASGVLSKFGDSFWMGEDIECEKMYEVVMTQVNILQKENHIGVENLQRFLCQYLLRTIAVKQENNAALIYFLTSISKQTVLDTNLQFFGPILEIVIDIENQEDVLINLIDMELEELDEDGYLYHINQCTKMGPDSILSSFLVSILKNVYCDKVSVEVLESVKGSSHDIINLACRASIVLRNHTECSLNLVASIAYLQALIHAYVALLKKCNMKANDLNVITPYINTLFERVDLESELEAQRAHCLLVYFLKCLSSVVESFEFGKILTSLEESLPVLKTLNGKEEYFTRSVIFDPLFMYRQDDDIDIENVLIIEKTEKAKFQEFVKQVLIDRQKTFSLAGFIASTFFLRNKQKKMTEAKRTISQYIVEVMSTKLPEIQSRVIELLSKTTDFAQPKMNIDTETTAPNFHIISILTHLLCLIVFKGEQGNCWYDILAGLNTKNLKFVPGKDVRQPDQTLTCNFNPKSCNQCKIRFVSAESNCPNCLQICNTSVKGQQEKELQRKLEDKNSSDEVITLTRILSPVTCTFLQFLTNGIVMLADAIKGGSSDQLETVLYVRNSKDMFDILQEKWNHLKLLTQMNNDDLCVFIHFLIHNMGTVFTLSKPPFHCKTEEECEQVEKDFESCLLQNISGKYKSIANARLSMYKTLDMDPNSCLECQIQEVCEVGEVQERKCNVSRLFRMTSCASTDGLLAQVFLGNNKTQFSLLGLILTKDYILALPKLILPILQWHKLTVSTGNYKMKKKDCKEITIEKFFKFEKEENRRGELEKRFYEFESAWNTLVMKHSHLLKSPPKPDDTVSSQSKVIDCIIINHESIILKVLEELVDIQNYFIDSCLKYVSTSDNPSLYFLKSGEQLSHVKSISLWDLTPKDVITFDLLTKEILRYSQCHSDFCEGKDRNYDLQKIENELAHVLFLDKPYIVVPNPLPKVLFVDELFKNTTDMLKNVRETLPQERLPQTVLNGIVQKKNSDSSQIIELMTVIGMSLSILNKTKGDPSLPLTEYLEGWKDKAVFPKAYKHLLPEPVDSIKLCHIVNLYVKLEELSGETMYGTLGPKYRSELLDAEKEHLKTTGEEFLGYLEALAEALKVSIHRCLADRNNTISVDQKLIDFINDEAFWQHNSLEDGHVSVNGKKKKLADILCSLRVKHIYNTIKFIQDFIKVNHIFIYSCMVLFNSLSCFPKIFLY